LPDRDAGDGGRDSRFLDGLVTDSHCGLKGAGAKHTASCAEKCVKDGGKLQFVNDADKKIYDIDKAHYEAAMAHVGHMVTVTGSVDGSALTVETDRGGAAGEVSGISMRRPVWAAIERRGADRRFRALFFMDSAAAESFQSCSGLELAGGSPARPRCAAARECRPDSARCASGGG
jgi:hypothetical protein